MAEQMELPAILPCPNCGDGINVPPTDAQFPCPTCGEELHRPVDENRFLLVHPLPNYFVEGRDDQRESEQWLDIEDAVRSIDFRKRKATVDISARRLAERMQLNTRILKIGLGLLVLSAILSGVALARILILQDIQIDAVILLPIGVMFAPVGLFFNAWSLLERRSLKRSESTIHEQRHVLEEEEDLFKYSKHFQPGDPSAMLNP